MKNKLIKTLTLLMVLSLMLALSACGDDNDDSSRTRTRNRDKNSAQSEGPLDTNNSHEVAFGNIVSLSDIRQYLSEDHICKTIYAIQLDGKDSYLILLDPEASNYNLSADEAYMQGYGYQLSTSMMFPLDRTFTMDPDKDKLVVFSDDRFSDTFLLFNGKSYAVPILFEDDGDFYRPSNSHLFGESLVSQNPDMELRDSNVTDLKINGTPLENLLSSSSYIKGYNHWDNCDSDYGYIILDSDKEISLSCTSGTTKYEATLKPAVLYGIDQDFSSEMIKTDPISYTITDDGYAIFDISSYLKTVPDKSNTYINVSEAIIGFN